MTRKAPDRRQLTFDWNAAALTARRSVRAYRSRLKRRRQNGVYLAPSHHAEIDAASRVISSPTVLPMRIRYGTEPRLAQIFEPLRVEGFDVLGNAATPGALLLSFNRHKLMTASMTAIPP